MRIAPRYRTLAYVLAVIAFAFVASICILTIATPAPAAGACASRPGISRGAVWWRWRYANGRGGARCWYPGTRSARSRHFFRPHSRAEKSTSPPKPATVEAMPPRIKAEGETRMVRTVPIYPGITPTERIESAFDMLIIFPMERGP